MGDEVEQATPPPTPLCFSSGSLVSSLLRAFQIPSRRSLCA